MPSIPRSTIARLAASLLLAGLAACAASRAPASMRIDEPTTETLHALKTITSTAYGVTQYGFEVATQGEDTILTCYTGDRAHRTVLLGRTGHKGRLSSAQVSLEIGDLSVWTDGAWLKVLGPGILIDQPVPKIDGPGGVVRADVVIAPDGELRTLGE